MWDGYEDYEDIFWSGIEKRINNQILRDMKDDSIKDKQKSKDNLHDKTKKDYCNQTMTKSLSMKDIAKQHFMKMLASLFLFVLLYIAMQTLKFLGIW